MSKLRSIVIKLENFICQLKRYALLQRPTGLFGWAVDLFFSFRSLCGFKKKEILQYSFHFKFAVAIKKLGKPFRSFVVYYDRTNSMIISNKER